ncbi:MAG: DUF4224 domain-containing protein [Burkholderiales bacterium]|nr:DUF4224 domain-containing protein [Burkholderiales bacterium]
MTDRLLTSAELERLTDRHGPARQARVLRAMGIPFSAHPFDGTPKVLWSVVCERLGAAAPAPDPANEDGFVVDVEAVERYGQKAS